jgi:alkanesulfonate monooxygenase SsuD/methylene tetrahydromethanopterin reductase-like flavin-dependent oxidoreductase (luciferase family)
VGAGWQQEEFEAEGLDHARRGQLLTDFMQACRVLWGPSPASFASSSVSFANVWCEPKPVRPNGPPVLFSGTLTQRNIDRIVGIGDGWIPIMGETVEGIGAGVRRLRDLLHAAGRDRGSLLVRTRLPVAVRDSKPNLEATLDAATVYVDAGVTDLVIGLSPFVSEPTAIGPWLAGVARRWQAVRG